MKTKLVYVLTSSENDLYYAQALMSVYSCRMHNKDALIYLVCDTETEKTLYGKRAGIREYLTDIIAVPLPSELNNVHKSRYLKTTLIDIINADFLYIDIDTIIARSLEDIDSVRGDFCAVPDCHISKSKEIKEEHNLDVMGWHELDHTILWNSGILLVRNTADNHQLFSLWHKYWKECVSSGLYFDQPGLRKAIHTMNIRPTELPGEWNCMITDKRAMNFYYKCRIIHYFNKTSSGWDFFSECREEIAQNGNLSESLKAFLQNPVLLANTIDGAPHRMKAYCEKPVLWNIWGRTLGRLFVAFPSVGEFIINLHTRILS